MSAPDNAAPPEDSFEEFEWQLREAHQTAAADRLRALVAKERERTNFELVRIREAKHARALEVIRRISDEIADTDDTGPPEQWQLAAWKADLDSVLEGREP